MTTLSPDANIYVIEVSTTAVLTRVTNNGASQKVWVRWEDLEAAAGPKNDPGLRALYFRALEAARLMRVVACPGHVAGLTRTEGFTCSVAPVAGADGVFAQGVNPSAHGAVCQVETCKCGATRRTNINGPHNEIGAWVYETREMLDEQGFPVTKAEPELTSEAPTPAIGDVVRIARGFVGEGYSFEVSSVGSGGHGELIVYGEGYGPVRASEVVTVVAARR